LEVSPASAVVSESLGVTISQKLHLFRAISTLVTSIALAHTVPLAKSGSIALIHMRTHDWSLFTSSVGSLVAHKFIVRDIVLEHLLSHLKIG
jgi:hypothetical protein